MYGRSKKTQWQMQLEQEIKRFDNSLKYARFKKKKKKKKVLKNKLGRRQWKEIKRMTADFLYHVGND